MGILAAHLNDAEIVVVSNDKILYREPGFALLEDDHLVTGVEAYAQRQPEAAPYSESLLVAAAN